ncbi:DNA methyltransferase [Saccharicrinis sp. 156]|uniref:DNA methyltransferase n=1 Tax=Saccharicrinis sp. 156 TaxID=3417574 RepID=UPI003D32A1B0
MQNLLNDLIGLLQQDERLVVDGKLLKNKIIELALQLDPALIKMLLSHESIKKHFFENVEGILVFDKIKFQKFVSNKAFLPDSYTSFKNRIGLTDDDEFIKENKDVVLAWPYKDCVLEGNQVSDKEKRKEHFWNEILAPDEIDRILSAKVLTNFNRVTPGNEKEDLHPSVNDNYLIKGNNLLTLYTLKETHKGRIKLIYIDPPYNTGNDDFGYNDRFNHSSWLTFMKNRLEVAKELLTKDGSIWINIDDVEAHYLKVLCDEMFGRENFVANVIWQKKFAPQNDAKYFSDNHDHILVYAKNKEVWKPNLLPRSEKTIARYKNPDEDPRGPWTSGDLTVKTYNADYDYTITTPSGKEINPPKGICWRVSKAKFQELVSDNRVWFGAEGSNVPRLKRFLSDVKDGQTPLTIWTHSEVGHNQEAKQELNKLLETDLFKTPKPERLMKRVIEIGSNEGDYVLDFFAGSGTTAATALKLKRRFITIEQMDYVESVTKLRLKKVVEGEQGGVSENVNWSGGSSFVYCELLKFNQKFADLIEQSTNLSELKQVLNTIKEKAFLKYQLNSSELSIDNEDFLSLDLDKQKSALIEVLDKNMLYVPLSEIDDLDYGLSNQIIKINKDLFTAKP